METLVTKKVSVVLCPIRRVMEVKERILQKATDLFMRYGIRSITMDEIATQLGISKKTIYQFFTDKDEIVEAVIDMEVKRNEDECLGYRINSENALHEIFIAVEELEELLKAMNPLLLYDLEKHHPRAYKKIRDYKYQFLYRMIRENLEKGISEELYRPDMNIDIVTKSRIETAFLVFNQDIFPHSRYKVSEVNYELAILFLHGITTDKGKLLIEKYSSERNKQLSYEHKG
jgi:AcrR family transcriptional regulator